MLGCASLNKGILSPGQLSEFAESRDGDRAVIKGYVWPHSEGSVLCDTTGYEECVTIANSKKLFKYRKGDFIQVRGDFEWVDIEAAKRALYESDVIFFIV